MTIKVKELLQSTHLFKTSYERIRSAEENFNIFSILYKEHNEKKLHSRFISSILSPQGSHGCGNRFLSFFLSQIKSVDETSFLYAEVKPNEKFKSEYKNIDILIIDRVLKNAVIIENKIFASDSNNEKGGQLERYFKIVRDEEKIPAENIHVVYLTLDGHYPTKESLGEFERLEDINGVCFSYGNQVLEWLNDCKTIVSDKPFVREVVFQYEKLIQGMTNNITMIEERKELKNLLGGHRNNLDAAKYLFDNFKHIKWHAVSDFWNDLKAELEKRQITVVSNFPNEAITNITHYSSNNKSEEGYLSFRTKEDILIYIWHESNCNLIWGVYKSDKENLQRFLDKVDGGEKLFRTNDFTFHRFVELKNGEEIGLKNFSQENTFNLISNRLRKETVSAIIDNICSYLKIDM